MDARMIERVRKYITKLQQRNHTEINFAEAVRSLVDQALEREGIR